MKAQLTTQLTAQLKAIWDSPVWFAITLTTLVSYVVMKYNLWERCY